jgi:hypothetical protein
MNDWYYLKHLFSKRSVAFDDSPMEDVAEPKKIL